MEKKNRKNRKPLIVVAMLLMVALVVGMGAMTYSRYVSSFNSGVQQATAAKWGFVVTANTENLFGKNYKVTGTNVATPTATADGVVVKATSDANVVAPGTSGSMTFSISGQAEVKANFKIAISGIQEIVYNGYKPIKWTLKKDGNPVVTNNDSLATTLASLTTATTINPGVPVEGGSYELSWSWAWSEDETISINDTIIGIASAGTYDDATKAIRLADGSTFGEKIDSQGAFDAILTKLSFQIAITIEQVQ